MFIRKSTYEKLLRDLYSEKIKLSLVVEEHNALVKKINEHGGEGLFIKGGNLQFDPVEIKCLLRLCHPDRHANSRRSTEMTQKLLSIRESMAI